MSQIILTDKNAVIPKRASNGSAGYDLCSVENITVPSKGRKLVKTGIKIQVPSGTYGRIAPRSGLAYKNGIDIGAGVIDSDYQGEVGVIMFNHDEKDFEVKIGDRIAQLIFEKIEIPDIVEVKEFTKVTSRGTGGFGSTGIQTVETVTKSDKDEKKT